MHETRQDAWSKEEDELLAETVLKNIKEGKTQLEAFKEVGVKLSRTPAACGFRWNATIRKQYTEAIQFAKTERKKASNRALRAIRTESTVDDDSIETVITLLENIKEKQPEVDGILREEHVAQISRLEAENRHLHQQIERYQSAWREIGRVWNWISQTGDDRILKGK